MLGKLFKSPPAITFVLPGREICLLDISAIGATEELNGHPGFRIWVRGKETPFKWSHHDLKVANAHRSDMVRMWKRAREYYA